MSRNSDLSSAFDGCPGLFPKLWPNLKDRGIDSALDAFRKHFPAMNTLHNKPIGPPQFAPDPLSIPSAARSQFVKIPTGFDPTRGFLRLHTTRMYYPTPFGLRLACGFSYAPLFLSGKEPWQVRLLAESYTLEQIQRWTVEPSVLIDTNSSEVLTINKLYPWTNPPPNLQVSRRRGESLCRHLFCRVKRVAANPYSRTITKVQVPRPA